MTKISILKVNIGNLDRKSILGELDSCLEGNGFKQIVTVNPEFVLEAEKNEGFRDIINNAELSLVDGVGINFAFWRKGVIPKSRITGADLVWEILERASKKKLKVFLVANKKGISSWRETRRAIREKYPFLKVYGMNLDPRINTIEKLKNLSKLHDSHVLLCNFGAPQQEFFVSSVRNVETKLRLVMGVGGSFDFMTRKIRRAPMIMRFFGLEWLWRLIVQPQRVKRIFRAVIVFPIKVMFSK